MKCTGTRDTGESPQRRNDDMSEKRVNIGIPEDVHTKAKVISVLKGMTLNDYLAEAIEERVRKDDKVLDNIR